MDQALDHLAMPLPHWREELEGANGQALMAMGEQLGKHLAARGCRGAVLLGVLARRGSKGWQRRAIEINLAKGDTTHPFQLAANATCDSFVRTNGLLRSSHGAAVFYEASEELQIAHWRGLLGARCWAEAAGSPQR